MPTAGVDGGAILQLEASALRMKKIGTNFLIDKINVGEMILGSIRYSLIWIVDEEEVPRLGAGELAGPQAARTMANTVIINKFFFISTFVSVVWIKQYQAPHWG